MKIKTIKLTQYYLLIKTTQKENVQHKTDSLRPKNKTKNKPKQQILPQRKIILVYYVDTSNGTFT